MKTKILSISIIITLFVSGCNFLDYDDSTHYTKETAFETFERHQAFLTNIYSYLPVRYGTIDDALRSAASDEAVFVDRSSAVHNFYNGAWSAVNTVDDGWQFFSGIRQANMFLAEAAGQEFDDLKTHPDYNNIMQQYRLYPYEARFLRAYFYFELARRYGAVPLITTVLTEEQANSVSRISFDQIIEFIVSECDALAEVLPASFSQITGQDLGRATKGAAMALKSRALLYAASPLHNPDNDPEKWRRAAKAAGEMISIAQLGLNAGGLNLQIPTLANLTNTWNRNYAQNTELILGVLRPNSRDFEQLNYPIGIVGGGSTGHAPTQNLVDAYEMTSGLPARPNSGYEEQCPNFNPANPYAGRDPRLQNAIARNNEVWPTVYGQPLEIWYGGKSGKPAAFASPTGYYMKKYVVGTYELRPGYTLGQGTRTWVLMRYSEVLLNYAEAVIEGYGDFELTNEDLPITAREAVRRVRARGGVAMPAFPESLTPEQFKLKLRNERMVELAFEDHRFWDIRRWKIGPETTEIRGVDIVKTGDDPATFTYTPIVVENRIFTDNMYFYPIPQRERLLNPNLTQNNGW